MAVELGRQAETSVVGQPARDTEMGKPVGSRPVWGEIELAESYLVCSMFEEAASSASSVLKRLCEKEGIADDIEVNDMLESAGMVFVQSLKELGRTLEIISELTQLFDSLAAIPLQVFLAGACFHMQEDPNGTQKYLKEFLSKWRLIDQKYYILASLETNNTSSIKGTHNRFILEIDTYLKVVELYITLLTSTIKPTNLAISWVEKASLPELIRQEYLRRLQSKDTGSEASTSALATDGNVTLKSSKTSESATEIDAKKAVLRKFGRNVPTLWWFRTFNVKFGGVRLAVSNGSVLVTTLMLIAYYYFVRRRKYTIISILKGQALFVKKCIMDLWQLAFSYQVNPLAAVEPLQNPTRITR